MRIDLVGYDCPVLPDVTVGLQRGREVVDTRPAAGTELRWRLDVTLVPGPDLRGPFVQGRRGGRFLYVCWLRHGEMFRRAKLMLDALPEELLVAADRSGLQGRLRLVMPDGSPVCASVRPPVLEWAVG